jgi:thiol-disulfide isomerase/thioredoxin
VKLKRSLSLIIGLALVLSACAGAAPTSTPEPQPSNTPLPAPAWLSVELNEASTGKPFMINNFKGKVVMVELMAIWCPNCLRQGLNIKKLRVMYSPDDLVIVTLDIDSHEDAAMLSDYAKQAGFDWSFGVAPMALMRDVGNTYGALFLDPTLSPTLIVDRNGEVFKMGFGEKKAEAMSKSLAPLIDAGK